MNIKRMAMIIGGAALSQFAGVFLEVWGSPAQHTNVPDHTDSLIVASCGSGSDVVLSDHFLSILRARLGTAANPC